MARLECEKTGAYARMAWINNNYLHYNMLGSLSTNK